MTDKKEARDQLASPHLTFNKLAFSLDLQSLLRACESEEGS